MPRIGGDLDVVQLSADPTAPVSGRAKLYFKSDGKLYRRTSDGTVTEVSGGGGTTSGGTTIIQQPNPPTTNLVDGLLWLDTDAPSTAVGASDLTATGTRDATTFLRGDNTWSVPTSSFVEAYNFSFAGDLKVGLGGHRIYLERNYTIESVRAAVGTPGDGDPIIIYARVYSPDGVGQATVTLNIPVNSNTSPSVTGAAGASTLLQGWYMRMEIGQVGGTPSFGTVPGSNLTVTIRLRTA